MTANLDGTRIDPPCIITPRLMQGVQIGTPAAWVSIGNSGRGRDGRTCYGAWIDYPDAYGAMQEYNVTDLQSGCGGGDDRAGLVGLLSFLAAAAESYEYRLRTGLEGENEDLFPAGVVLWAYTNRDEIGMLVCEIEEGAQS